MTSHAAPISEPGARSARPARRRFSLSFIGVVPFFLFAILALLIPIGFLIIGSFQDTNNGDALTLKNYADLATDSSIVRAYGTSIEISLVTAVGGAIFGFLLAYSVILGGLPGFLRTALMTFSGVASNFAGVPLAFAFIATLGQLGLVTQALRSIGIALYPSFSLYSFWGLAITYVYFQIPLMVLVMTPALDGLKREWREAADNLGANASQYWRYIALPVLLPSILGTMALLFGNAFGAHATAFALTGGGSQGNVVTILIGAQLSSDALSNPGLGNALAFGMIVIMVITIGLYSWMRRLSERWSH